MRFLPSGLSCLWPDAELLFSAQRSFCPFAMIIENPNERLFHCHRPDCRIVSCRDCKKRDHLPKTCAEVTDSELKLKSVHHVEEAMTEALIRRCPKPGCNEPYVKESGTCNKIRCSNCGTLSCYICNKMCVTTPPSSSACSVAELTCDAPTASRDTSISGIRGRISRSVRRLTTRRRARCGTIRTLATSKR